MVEGLVNYPTEKYYTTEKEQQTVYSKHNKNIFRNEGYQSAYFLPYTGEKHVLPML